MCDSDELWAAYPSGWLAGSIAATTRTGAAIDTVIGALEVVTSGGGWLTRTGYCYGSHEAIEDGKVSTVPICGVAVGNIGDEEEGTA